MLTLEGLSVTYGGLHALSAVSVEVRACEFVAIVGPNGAGKTTLFKAISGTVTPDAGRIMFEERDLLALQPFERAHLGIAHIPEGRQVFAAMSVIENLELGWFLGAERASQKASFDRVFSLFPQLAECRHQLAGTLSGGQQQMLAIGRGLASSPKLMMLDEPSMGLAPAVADAIFERIGELHREDGLTILLVEQRVGEALENCDRAYVLESGRVVLSGSHQELSRDDRVRRAYLGM